MPGGKVPNDHEQYEENTERSLGRIEGHLAGITTQLSNMQLEMNRRSERQEGDINKLRTRVDALEAVGSRIIGAAVVVAAIVGGAATWIVKKLTGGQE